MAWWLSLECCASAARVRFPGTDLHYSLADTENTGRLAQRQAQGKSSSSKKRKFGNKCELRVNPAQQKKKEKKRNCGM